VLFLSRLAAAARGRGSTDNLGDCAGELAIFSTRSLILFVAALYSAAGVLVAAVLAELFMRFRSRWATENRRFNRLRGSSP
jgi:hypothetical protein